MSKRSLFARSAGYCLSAALLFAVVTSGVAFAAPPDHAKGKPPAATAQSILGGPMILKDEGIFFVNGDPIISDFPRLPPDPGTIVVNQMYVHFRIPANAANRPPIVMVHGGGLTGASYETTPDGREGWATYFVRKGYPVYVVDFPGRGRAGFDPTAINQAKFEDDVGLLPASVNRTSAERAWVVFRFGPTFGTPFPDVLFPVESMVEFGSQGVPGTDAFLPGGALTQAPAALAALLDKIGPAVVVVHSQSGPFADRLVELRPNLVKGVINVEGNQNTVPTDAQIAAYQNVPDLELFGDYIDVDVSTGKPRYEGRKLVVERINEAGGNATIVSLPEVGMHGNTHMLMQDKNNLEVADYLIEWIKDNVN